jgi:hypothetical protein
VARDGVVADAVAFEPASSSEIPGENTKSRIAAVFMTQVLPFADNRTLRIYRQFERGIYGTMKEG